MREELAVVPWGLLSWIQERQLVMNLMSSLSNVPSHNWHNLKAKAGEALFKSTPAPYVSMIW